MPAWFALSIDLAAVTLQRREDLTAMRFSHIVNDRLQVIQGKTGMMISISLDLELTALGLKLRAIVDRCRLASQTDFLISPGVRKNSL